jgi:monoamine oxidase
MRISRRELFSRIGRAGGAGALFFTMQSLGYIRPVTGSPTFPLLEPHPGNAAKVLILGGGIAGLTAAYELTLAGYDCRILEAEARAGGRSLTVRRGDVIREIDGTTQTCAFEPGEYLNSGPARIPSAHQTLLGYCRTFGVPLEVFVNDNRSALFQDDNAFSGKPVLSRQVHYDSAGWISELLAKAIVNHALDEEISTIDTERLLEFLSAYGNLSDDHAYYARPEVGTYDEATRIGYDVAPGAFDKAGQTRPPLGLQDLVNSNFWHWKMHVEKSITLQTTMLQPVGGMDQIVRAFTSRLEDHITYNAKVTELRHTESGVRVVIEDTASGGKQAAEADYCICTLPLTVLSDVASDLDAEYAGAIRGIDYVAAVKLGWQASRRFWEEDEAIYGGISYVDDVLIEQIWYPCSAFNSRTGIIMGGYTLYDDAVEIGGFTPDERAARARSAGTKLHRQMETEVGQCVSVPWHRMPLARGAWAEWTDEQRQTAYVTLSRPERRIYFAGEHMSWLPGWQEGAVLSARDAVTAIHQRVQQSNP